MLVEEGPDLYADEVDYEEVEAEDPAILRRRVVGELVLGEVGLEDGGGIDETKDGEHGTKGPKDDQPGLPAAFGEGQFAGP